MVSPTPPPRPKVAITPMRPARGVRPRFAAVVVALWAVAVALVVASVLLVATHLTEIRVALAVDLARERPDATGDEVVRAINIALLAGTVVATVVVLAAVVGCVRAWEGRRSARGWFVIAGIAAAALAVGGAVTIGSSSQAVADAGLPTAFQWIVPAIACALGVIATVIAIIGDR